MGAGLETMEKLRIAVCDDEKVLVDLAKEKVEHALEIVGIEDYQVDVYQCGKKLTESGGVYDLVLLDIDMPEMDGFQVTEKLSEMEKKPLVIFWTGYKDRVFDGHNYRPYVFLSKDCADERFNRVVGDAVRKITMVETVILKAKDERRVVINVEDIMYIQAHANESYVYVEEMFTSKQNLVTWQKESPVGMFFQSHKSYLVNLMHVKGFNKEEIILKNGMKVPLSTRNASKVKAAMNEFLRIKGRG